MSIYIARPPVAAPVVVQKADGNWKAGPIGPGAGVLQTEFPLALILGRGTPSQQMRRNLQIAREAAWPEAAENVIGTAISGQPWSLETPDESEVDDTYGEPIAQQCYALIEKPQVLVDQGRRYTRSELWRMTSRHVGLCGNAFWMLDAYNQLNLPGGIVYIAPWRMTPNEDANGNLLSWQLDQTATSPGLEIGLDVLVHFMLYPPDQGHYGRSIMEIALQKAQNDSAFDSHVAKVLSAGGRLSGLLAPKQGIIDEPQYNAIVQDARTVIEQPDAAKRLQVIRAPVDFTQTTMTIQDLQVAELLKLYRDDTLALWGVPSGLLVPGTGAGLNSGEARKYDKQVMWENAAHARVVMFEESIQLGIVDLWDRVTQPLTFEIEEPPFGADDARYDLLNKSLNTPLRNSERRALINLDPFGPDVVNPATGQLLDDEVWLPMTQQMVFAAPEEGQSIVSTPDQPAAVQGNENAVQAAGETPQSGDVAQAAKASIPPHMRGLHGKLTALRRDSDERVTPRLKQSVAQVLTDQRRELIARLRTGAAHLLAAPRDADYLRSLWDAPRWDRRMKEALQPALIPMAEQVDTHIRSAIAPRAVKAGPVAAVAYAIDRGGTRITAINDRTRDAVLAVIRQEVAQAVIDGDSPAQLAAALETALSDAKLDNGQPAFDELRAETIARTELMAAYNNATLGSYTEHGVAEVQAIDGHGDPECLERDGRIFPIDEADAIEDHPNGTLDWLPVVTPGKATITELIYDASGRVKEIVERTA